MTTPLAIHLTQVSRSFKNPAGGAPVTVLHPLDLVVQAGEQIAIIGPSGSGKSTLLGLMAGLDAPSSGTVEIAGQNLNSLGESALARFRGRNIGFVFQSFRLLPHLSALENVRIPLELAGRRDAQDVALQWLETVGLSSRHHHLPAKLSGGEQQRVAIARALAVQPSVIFADEPTGNLDSSNGTHIADLLLELSATHQRTLVLVTHEKALAARCPRVLALRDGRVESDTRTTAVA